MAHAPAKDSAEGGCAPHEFRGTTILDLDEAVDRLFEKLKNDGPLRVCPQDADCAGDGTPTRILECEEGCGFRGCAACMAVHEEEPHLSDSDTAREMYRGVARDRASSP